VLDIENNSRTFLDYFQGHFIFMNNPLKKDDEPYTYSLKVRKKLCLLIGARSFPSLKE
jgi:hypothetical protein